MPWPQLDRNIWQTAGSNTRQAFQYPSHGYVSARPLEHPLSYGSVNAPVNPVQSSHLPIRQLRATTSAATPVGLTSTPGASAYPFTPHPDSLHMHYQPDQRYIASPSASPLPSFYQTGSTACSSPFPPSPQPSMNRLPDNEANLEKMKKAREQVFERAAREQRQAKLNASGPVASNKSWEEAWEELRRDLTGNQ